MLIPLFYTLNVLILFSGLLGFRQGSGERNFSLTLVQTLMVLPLLACEYLYLAYHWEPPAVHLVLFSELVLILIIFSFALRLNQVIRASVDGFRRNFLVEIGIGTVLLAMAIHFLLHHSLFGIFDEGVFFSMYGPIYFSSVLTLIVVLYAAWRLEEFWRPLSGAGRWEYKFLVVGSFLVCGTLAWSSSYRLTYLTILPKHLHLLSALLLTGWAMMCYAVFHHRLLNRKIFVSRKVVYAFVVPSLLATYLLGFGIVSLLMRTFDLEMSFVLKWLFLTLGFVVVGLFACSGKIRRRVHFFISTHFYINKYEYRDEWLALSQQLQGASTETAVVRALREVLAESLYTTEIFIWLGGGDTFQEYKLVSSPVSPDAGNHEYNFGSNDSLVYYLHSHSHFHVYEKDPDQAWQEVRKNKESFLSSLNLTLIAPISIGNHLTGLIGLGPEFTGGKYGHDDFDLLIALGSQTASALLAVRIAEVLAHTREQQAWQRLSAFVLHDIKNAATMLSLLQENAPEHIHEPEFQQDMLELVDDALRRMGRVEQRLGALKEEITPELQNIELGRFLQGFVRKIKKKLPLMEIKIEDSGKIEVRSDPELFGSVVENLLLNAYEARGEGAVVRITIGKDDGDQARVEIIDNGPGILAELLPDRLFEPFKTSKDGGSGIGLWQVKRLVTTLRGTISANNHPDGGAHFVIALPLTVSVE